MVHLALWTPPVSSQKRIFTTSASSNPTKAMICFRCISLNINIAMSSPVGPIRINSFFSSIIEAGKKNWSENRLQIPNWNGHRIKNWGSVIQWHFIQIKSIWDPECPNLPRSSRSKPKVRVCLSSPSQTKVVSWKNILKISHKWLRKARKRVNWYRE